MIGLQQIGIKTFENENKFKIASPKKKDEYILRNVTGLTGANLNVNYQKTLYSGSVHMGSRREEREITLLFELNPDRSKGSTVESLRSDIYRHIISDELVDGYTRVTLYGSKMDLYTEGRISQIESDLYSQKPMMQVSIMCRYAHFINTVPEPKRESVVGDEDTGINWTITNSGAPVGFDVRGFSDTEFSQFIVENKTNGQNLSVSQALAVEGTRWRFDVDTTPEERKVRKLGFRVDTWWAYGVYDKLTLEGGYPQLESGVNKIEAHIIGGTNKTFELTYTRRYHGV